jgi:large subunit ribosomal protein L24
MKLRNNDNVLVIKGRDRGKQGAITQIFLDKRKVVVEGVNVVVRHTKPTGTVRQAGIIQKEMPLHAANVMLICTHCNRPTRVGSRILADGTKGRVCTRSGCQEVIE